MNNEPVAWMDKDTKSLYLDIPKKHYNDANMIPLYTHPAKTQADIEYEADKAYWRTRTLTDEEIKQIWKESHVNGALEFEIVNIFARAILRKAQEK